MSTCRRAAGLYYLIINLVYMPVSGQLHIPAAVLPLWTHCEDKNSDLCLLHNRGDLICVIVWIRNVA
jgi:hypothetical protein